MQVMLVRLSYPLSSSTPFYDSLAPPSLNQLYSLERGDTCNSYYLTTSNHAGTHVDAPRHFNASGRAISSYSPDELTFTRPAIIPVVPPSGLLLRAADLDGAARVSPDCDFLFVRTGFGSLREKDPHAYVNRGPGFSREAAEFLMQSLPGLRAIAMDFVSASSMLHEDEGAEAHRVFLGCPGYSDRSVLLVEDVMIPADLSPPTRVLIVPWLFEGLDSAPCTVLAEL
jgi:arylformamidase